MTTSTATTTTATTSTVTVPTMTTSNPADTRTTATALVADDRPDGTFRRAQQRSERIEADLRADPTAYRVVTGDRPTGDLHLGHYIGTLANRVRLQNAGVPVTVVIADYQVITDRERPGPLGEQVRTLVADYLAAGLDPERTAIFPHSAVPALNQLLLPFLSLVSVAELHRNPTVKAESLASRRTLSALLLTYPVHQAADILCCQGTLVPVGKDQLPHVELARVIARRFNDRYGPVFGEPEALLSSAPVVLGVDGAKMSKTRGNTITLGADEDQTTAAIRAARTDGLRRITFDPVSRPSVANLLTIVGALSGREPVRIAEDIRDGGAEALKALAAEVVNESLRDLRARRMDLLADPGYLDEVLLDGTVRASAAAGETLERVRAAMGMDYFGG
jgi:tryptophanyl-tRNA synthetase